ncbi:MAG TPA: transposase, partial [Methylococcales bacterium]
MRKTFPFRLYPTRHQHTLLLKILDACRWVYNETLATRKNAWEKDQKTISLYDANKLLPAWKVENPELARVHSQVFQNVQERVDLAFQAYFRRVKSGDAPGYPRFKGKGRYDSFTFKQSGFTVQDNGLCLFKIGTVKIIFHRPIEGKIKTLTVRKDRVGNWFACFSSEVEISPLPPIDKVVGIDLGLATFAVCSDGKEIKRERWMKRDAKDIARLQRKKETFAKGSSERKVVVKALQHAFQRQANQRKNFAHQESRKLVNEYQFIAFEDLNITGMQAQGNKVINRGIADVAWNQFVQITSYKAVGAGRSVVLVDPKNTTQICSGCGEIVSKDLSIRTHACPHCGLKLGRDQNAALNI